MTACSMLHHVAKMHSFEKICVKIFLIRWRKHKGGINPKKLMPVFLSNTPRFQTAAKLQRY